MALESHLEQLSEKHRRLEASIEEEMSRPDWDELKVKSLKIKKLYLKEEIERLRSDLH
ncbi:MAG: DUF465 domain-containing protein [Alphaproteobacteria bacterium]|nr:DUF465 domain-containing protein [Alphaproteobacteria bacterium]